MSSLYDAQSTGSPARLQLRHSFIRQDTKFQVPCAPGGLVPTWRSAWSGNSTPPLVKVRPCEFRAAVSPQGQPCIRRPGTGRAAVRNQQQAPRKHAESSSERASAHGQAAGSGGQRWVRARVGGGRLRRGASRRGTQLTCARLLCRRRRLALRLRSSGRRPPGLALRLLLHTPASAYLSCCCRPRLCLSAVRASAMLMLCLQSFKAAGTADACS